MAPEGGQRRDAVANRQAVIDAAAELLPENPDASMQEIADFTGLGRSTVYRHFPDHESLISGLVERVIASAAAGIESIVQSTSDPGRVLHETAKLNIRTGVRYSFLHSHRSISRPLMQEFARRGEGPLAAFLAEARDRGKIRDDQPVEWMLSVILALTVAMLAEIVAERLDPDEGAMMLGDSFVAAIVPS
jgi:AcrR family transcriptional regulator